MRLLLVACLLGLLALPTASAVAVGQVDVTMAPANVILTPGQVRAVTVTLTGTIDCMTDEPPGDAVVYADIRAYMWDDAVVWSLTPGELNATPRLSFVGGPLPPAYQFEVDQEFTLLVGSDAAMNETVDSNVTFEGIVGGDTGCDLDGWEWRAEDTDTLRIRVPGAQQNVVGGGSPGGGEPGAGGALAGSSSDLGGLVVALTTAAIVAVVGIVVWSRRKF